MERLEIGFGYTSFETSTPNLGEQCLEGLADENPGTISVLFGNRIGLLHLQLRIAAGPESPKT
jgi:hypothetical protein